MVGVERQRHQSVVAMEKILRQVVSLPEMLARTRSECQGLLRLKELRLEPAVCQGHAAALNRLTPRVSTVLPQCVEQADVWVPFLALYFLPPLAVETLQFRQEAQPQR
jgi:hypothetical protein